MTPLQRKLRVLATLRSGVAREVADAQAEPDAPTPDQRFGAIEDFVRQGHKKIATATRPEFD
jgi:hypothetical protein